MKEKKEFFTLEDFTEMFEGDKKIIIDPKDYDHYYKMLEPFLNDSNN